MFISCLHCRELVAIERETGLAPEMCPRCGGVLRTNNATDVSAGDVPTTGKRSFISFLQGGETAAAAATAPAAVSTIETVDEATAAVPGLLESIDEKAAEAEAEAESGNGTGMIDEATPGLDPLELDATEGDAVTTSAIPAPNSPVRAPTTQAFPATPSFTRQTAYSGIRPHTAGWQWSLLIVLLLMLVLQVLLADRVRLAADASWRPLITSVCNVLGCSVPPWHQPGAFAMLSRDVSPIPGISDGLNVQATFRNDARWAQAWPVLLLSLSDADGRVLGSRAFSPREYLGTAVTQMELAPGQSAQISLQLHEPDPGVVAFSFDFR
ncbi:MAG: DUF3426 domain-containing protein [Pseudoxanthomonas sp.]